MSFSNESTKDTKFQLVMLKIYIQVTDGGYSKLHVLIKDIFCGATPEWWTIIFGGLRST